MSPEGHVNEVAGHAVPERRGVARRCTGDPQPRGQQGGPRRQPLSRKDHAERAEDAGAWGSPSHFALSLALTVGPLVCEPHLSNRAETFTGFTTAQKHFHPFPS